MGTELLDTIRHRINAGDREGAKHQLADLLEADSENVDAWALLAILLKEPAEQAECYRQILRIDPENRQAAAWLAALTPQILGPAAPERPSAGEGMTLQCNACGGVTEVRFVGELRDKGAFCPYCGNHIDLPDTFVRVERTRQHEQIQGGGSRSVDSVIVEARRDHMPGDELIPGGDEIDRVLQELDLPDIDDEALRQLRERGLVGGTGEKVVLPSRAQEPERSFLDRLLGRRETGTRDRDEDLLAALGQEDATPKAGSFSPDDILKLAGGPLPEEERRECPSCKAVVSRSESKCPWCSASLAAT